MKPALILNLAFLCFIIRGGRHSVLQDFSLYFIYFFIKENFTRKGVQHQMFFSSKVFVLEISGVLTKKNIFFFLILGIGALEVHPSQNLISYVQFGFSEQTFNYWVSFSAPH